MLTLWITWLHPGCFFRFILMTMVLFVFWLNDIDLSAPLVSSNSFLYDMTWIKNSFIHSYIFSVIVKYRFACADYQRHVQFIGLFIWRRLCSAGVFDHILTSKAILVLLRIRETKYWIGKINIDDLILQSR